MRDSENIMINYFAKKLNDRYLNSGDELSKKKVVIAYIYSFVMAICVFVVLGISIALFSTSGKSPDNYIDKYASLYANEVQSTLGDSSIQVKSDLTEVFYSSYKAVFFYEDKFLGYDAVIFSGKTNLFFLELSVRQKVVLLNANLRDVTLIELSTPHNFLSEIEPSFFNLDYVFLTVLFYLLIQLWILSSAMRASIYGIKASKLSRQK
jgi:hypothetical protein